jgi:anti-anti-sigma factor
MAPIVPELAKSLVTAEGRCWTSPVTPTSSDGWPPPDHSASGDASVFFDDEVTLVLLSGEVDLALGDDLEYAGRDAIDRGVPVRVDVSRVTFIDSVGLGFLARIASAEREQGRRLPLAGARRNVQESVNLVGLGDLVEFVELVGDAPDPAG